MKKSLREKLINLNGKKVRLISKVREYNGILEIKFYDYLNGNNRKDLTMNVYCIINDLQYGITLKNIIDVEEI